MKQHVFFAVFGLGVLFATSCTKEKDPIDHVSFDFSRQQHNWIAGFADYSDVYEDLELNAEMALLPEPLNPSGKVTGLKVQGLNRPDDLFMFIKRKMTGLEPNKHYTVKATIQFASDAPRGGIGIGGAPGEAVFMKAGAVNFEPTVSKNAQGTYTVNLDKGNQGQGGRDMKIIGNVAKVDDSPGYVSLVRKAEGINVKTNDQGEFWLIIGTDSGYEGMTRLYYQKIEVQIE